MANPARPYIYDDVTGESVRVRAAGQYVGEVVLVVVAEGFWVAR